MVAYSLVRVRVGIIGAVMLYLLFAAGLLKGDLFPEFHCTAPGEECDSFRAFVSDWSPKDSERFAPNVLNRFAPEDEK